MGLCGGRLSARIRPITLSIARTVCGLSVGSEEIATGWGVFCDEPVELRIPPEYPAPATKCRGHDGREPRMPPN